MAHGRVQRAILDALDNPAASLQQAPDADGWIPVSAIPTGSNDRSSVRRAVGVLRAAGEIETSVHAPATGAYHVLHVRRPRRADQRP